MAKRKTATAATATKPGAPAISTIVESGYNAHATHKGSEQVIQKSETEGLVESGLTRTLEMAGELAQRWDARVQTESTKVWVCPFDKPTPKRPTFATKPKCAAYTRATYPQQLAQAKLEKKPAAFSSPQMITIPPKLTVADYVLPQHRGLIEAAQRAQKNVAQQRVLQQQSGMGKTPGMLVAMAESMAIPHVPGLSAADLQLCAYTAYYRSRSQLFKACQAEAKKRGQVLRV